MVKKTASIILLIGLMSFVSLCALQKNVGRLGSYKKRTVPSVLKNFSWISTSPYIGGMALPQGLNDIKILQQLYNVGLLVTLTESPLPASYFVSVSGITNLHLPIIDQNVPTLDQVATFLAAAKATHAQGKAVVVHCKAGVGRAGTMLACWMIFNTTAMTKYGMTGSGVIAALRKLRPRSVSSATQKRFIAAYLKIIQYQRGIIHYKAQEQVQPL